MPKCVTVIVAIALLGLTAARTYNGFYEDIQGYGKHNFGSQDNGFEYHIHGIWPPTLHSHSGYQLNHHQQRDYPKQYGYHHQPRDYDIPSDEYWPNDFVKWDPDWVFPDEDRLSEPWTSTTSSTTVGPAVSNSLAIQLCMRSCRVTPEYNPVCGTDNVTYSNPGKLECAKYCGVDVEVQRSSPCKKPDTANNGKPNQSTPAPNPLSIDNLPIKDESTKPPNDPVFTISNDILASIFPTTEESPEIDIRFPEKESTPSP